MFDRDISLILDNRELYFLIILNSVVFFFSIKSGGCSLAYVLRGNGVDDRLLDGWITVNE